jgi:hypothetical protein
VWKLDPGHTYDEHPILAFKLGVTRAKAYHVIGDELYKILVIGPLLRCLSKAEGKELLAKVHLGVCRGNIGSRALTRKIFRQGFYWPLIIDDTSKVIATCEACQKISPNFRAPSQPSQLITPSLPLQRWGINIVRPLTTAQGNYKYAVVAVEYFTKWIDAKPLVNIAATDLKRFFWQSIICRFEVSRKITVDNAKQFDCNIFKDFCHQMGIKGDLASVYHPQFNGAVERANTLIFFAIKKILEDQPKGKWVEELPRVVWSHNTSISRSMIFTPFKFLYGEEPITPEESKLHGARTRVLVVFSLTKAESKDLLELECMKVIENLQTYQNETRVWRDKRVKQKSIEVENNISPKESFSRENKKLKFNVNTFRTLQNISTFRNTTHEHVVEPHNITIEHVPNE